MGSRGRRSFGRDGKDRELRFEPGGVAFRTLGFFSAVNEGFELMMAFAADVFEDGHRRLRVWFY